VTAGEAAREAVGATAEAPPIPLPHRDARGRQRYVHRRWGSLAVGHVTLPAGRTAVTIEALSRPGQQVLELKGVVLRLEGGGRFSRQRSS